MSAAEELQYFDSELQKEDCGDDDLNDIEGNIIVDADGNYYYQSTESTVKVERLTKIPGTHVKKVAAAVLPQEKIKKRAEDTKKTVKKTKIDISEVKIINRATTNNANETIRSEIHNQEKVYEFDENEQDPDDPQELQVQNCESKGIIKPEKSKNNDSSSFPCMICPYVTNKKFLLTRHLKTHSDERPFKCDVCERGFKTNAALTNHRNIHLGRKPHPCSSCDMAFTTSGELVRHVRYRHTHIKPHKCTECDYSSVEMSKLRRHMRCHTGERPYQCPHCTYASPDTFKLKRHMRIHTGEKPYECDICHARFTQSNSLKLHRLIHSVSEKPVFQCHLCPTTCGRKTDLRMHIKKLHSSDHPLPCKRCGKELPDRYSYKMHVKTHEGEKCFRCEYCPYASISQRHLDSHMLIHLDEKPFICEICQSRFRQKQLLARHTKIYHSDNYEPPKQRRKDHKCPHCDKMFAFNGNLIRHMEIHDPDLQRSAQKDQLKLGRLKHVKADGTIVTVVSSNKFSKLFDENEELFYHESKETQQAENEELQEELFEETEVYDEDNIQYVYDDYEADEFQEQNEEEEYEKHHDETKEKMLLIDVKEEGLQSMYIGKNSCKPDIIVKVEEKTDSETMALEDQDDQDFMVIEVLSADEDNEEMEIHPVQNQEIKPIIINKKANMSKNKISNKNPQTLISDYFGFEVNADDDDDEETKGAIKILEMIEQE